MVKNVFAAVMILALSFACQSTPMHAQQSADSASAPTTASDEDIQLFRQDLRSQKKQLIAANLVLTDAEAVKFWPVYDQYTAETAKLNDERFALIKEYAQSYDTMTDAQAASLTKRANALDESFVQLRGKYIPIFSKVIPAKKTAVFFQMDRRVALLIDLQLASMIPIAKQAQ